MGVGGVGPQKDSEWTGLRRGPGPPLGTGTGTGTGVLRYGPRPSCTDARPEALGKHMLQANRMDGLRTTVSSEGPGACALAAPAQHPVLFRVS